ncbi:PREDICTED: uncharacterized protein LOC108749170 [Trachymyrmex septentrionalis]|uniref:uncharacterized protein LOC108749170 n=1 Tax=Trachymyrmex septentrionalis TaxID=34720 RepID=UPI00084F1224|nr:PREDICTED: uncharacterized protein LOC108749170 [Trachymyrmex septentrionalis]
MSFARIYIATVLLIHGFCNAETTGSREIEVNDSDSIERFITDDAADVPDAKRRKEEKEEQRENIEDMLPILPPIILLDFDNGTIEDNATDEKSKRTVNNGLGNYGFDRNSLLAPRKYNYYFPAGKTGTTVSIEESISPFLPRTIIEKIPPSNRKPISDSIDFEQQESRASTGSNYQSYNSMIKSPQVFGLRTKLTKTSDSDTYQGFTPIARPSIDAYSNVDFQDGVYASTTPQSLTFGPAEAITSSYVTQDPRSYTASSSSRYTYVTPNPSSYIQRYLGQSSQHTINVQNYSRPKQGATKSSTSSPHEAAAFSEHLNSRNYARPGSNTVESSTLTSDDASSYSKDARPFPNLPRYTVENGVRYENKIFWKYPDGRVSDEPPKTYETYSEYPSLAALQAAKDQDASQVYESASTEGSVMSQGPVQFPLAPEISSSRVPFISANSLSRLQQQQQAFRLGYQSFINHKQTASQQVKAGSGVSPTYSIPSTTLSPRNPLKSTGKSPKNRYETLRPISKYMVNSPNPEYINNAEKNAKSTRLFTSSADSNLAKKNTGDKNLDSYSNLQYSDLLNYNPSISQYIKNPASILNVQPTFVQAGSSLIPVIILRVDGVPPIQRKATPNMNLKALLQQYLVQYAKSIEELAQQSNYDLGDDQSPKDQSSFSTSPLRELARLTSNDPRDLIGNPTESYFGKSSYETSNLDGEKNPSSGKYGERTAVRPKVKSVQIIEDPIDSRLANHRL